LLLKGVGVAKVRWLIVATVVLAAAQFAKCYSTLTIDYLNLTGYAHGTDAMPYQGRLLMTGPLLWAQNNPRLIRYTAGREGAFRSPDILLITIVAFCSLLLTCYFVTQWYKHVSQRQRFPWLPSALLLVIVAVQYILHSQNVMYPYDLPSMLFFTMGMYLIYTERAWWTVALFPFATLNREVTMFLIPLLMLDRYVAEGNKGLRKPALVAQVVLMCAMWLGLHWFVGRMFAANPTEMGSRLVKNCFNILKPQNWPQLAATGSYLLPFLWVYRKRITQVRLRTYLLLIVPWAGMMFFYGEIVETRLFGELSALIALTAALAFEESVAARERLAQVG
jgi:hypothetical protein